MPTTDRSHSPMRWLRLEFVPRSGVSGDWFDGYSSHGCWRCNRLYVQLSYKVEHGTAGNRSTAPIRLCDSIGQLEGTCADDAVEELWHISDKRQPQLVSLEEHTAALTFFLSLQAKLKEVRSKDTKNGMLLLVVQESMRNLGTEVGDAQSQSEAATELVGLRVRETFLMAESTALCATSSWPLRCRTSLHVLVSPRSLL